MGTADPDMDASISSGHIHSSMDTDTIITELFLHLQTIGTTALLSSIQAKSSSL